MYVCMHVCSMYVLVHDFVYCVFFVTISDVLTPNVCMYVGVGHKERLKALAPNTDVLTLSATPIPRTLQAHTCYL